MNTNEYDDEFFDDGRNEPDIPEECCDPETGLISEERVAAFYHNRR